MFTNMPEIIHFNAVIVVLLTNTLERTLINAAIVTNINSIENQIKSNQIKSNQINFISPRYSTIDFTIRTFYKSYKVITTLLKIYIYINNKIYKQIYVKFNNINKCAD